METVGRTSNLVPPAEGSALALTSARLAAGEALAIEDGKADSLLYVSAGAGSIGLGSDTAPLRAGSAALVLAGEEASVEAGPDGLELLHATVGPEADRHAPLGPRELATSLGYAGAEKATGARSFQILFGPHNGSTRATLFAGFIPPGRAPWHYHLYDEIVWVPEGPGWLHLDEDATELGPGSAFRLRPREVHIVEKGSAGEMTVVGIFTPAGSPSAAYLAPEVTAEYRFAG